MSKLKWEKMNDGRMAYERSSPMTFAPSPSEVYAENYERIFLKKHPACEWVDDDPGDAYYCINKANGGGSECPFCGKVPR